MYKIRFAGLKFPFSPRHSISHKLIIISVIVSIFGFTFPIMVDIFGLHRVGIHLGTVPFIIGQIVLFQFFHGGWMHLFFNSYFLYQAGPEIEARMKKGEYLLFFLGSTIFVAIALWIFSPNSLTIGISGFCMALLSYLYLDLTRIRHPFANQILFMLIINIALGFTGNISFVGHASGAVFGLLWWYIRNKR